MRAIGKAIAAGALALGIAFGGAAQANHFRMGFQGNLNTLDPYTINETFTLAFLGSVYEGLTRRGPNLEIIPGLAERWEISRARGCGASTCAAT